MAFMEFETFSLLAFVLYLASAGVLGMRLRHGTASVGVVAFLLWLFALAGHATDVGISMFTPEGVNLAFFKAGSVTALLIAAILLFNCLRKPLAAAALFVLPAAALFVLLGSLDDHRVVVATTGGMHVTHVLSSLLAYSVLGLTGVQAITLHFQNRGLKKTDTGLLLRALPPLDAMESFLFHLLTLGFALLTLSLITGWIHHHDLLAQHLLYKTILSAAAWLIFAALLLGHLFSGWRGAIAVRLTLTGAGLLVVGYSGSKFMLEYVLQRV